MKKKMTWIQCVSSSTKAEKQGNTVAQRYYQNRARRIQSAKRV